MLMAIHVNIKDELLRSIILIEMKISPTSCFDVSLGTIDKFRDSNSFLACT